MALPATVTRRRCSRRVTARITTAEAFTTCNGRKRRATLDESLPRRSVSWPAASWARGCGCCEQRPPRIEVKARRSGRDHCPGRRDERKPGRWAGGSRAWNPWPRLVCRAYRSPRGQQAAAVASSGFSSTLCEVGKSPARTMPCSIRRAAKAWWLPKSLGSRNSAAAAIWPTRRLAVWGPIAFASRRLLTRERAAAGEQTVIEGRSRSDRQWPRNIARKSADSSAERLRKWARLVGLIWRSSRSHVPAGLAKAFVAKCPSSPRSRWRGWFISTPLSYARNCLRPVAGHVAPVSVFSRARSWLTSARPQYGSYAPGNPGESLEHSRSPAMRAAAP